MTIRTLLTTIVLAGSMPVASLAADYTLNVGLVGGPQAPEVIAMGQFAEEVETATDGRIEVRVQSGGALGGDRDVIEGVQLGTVEMAVPSTSVVANFVPDLKIFDIPFLFRDFDHADAVLNGPVGQEILDEMPDQGLVGLAYGGMGFRELTNNVRPVQKAADVEGLKIRTQQNDMHIAVWEALGVLPTPMAIPEVYTALQQGVVDGQENPVGAILNNRFGEVQKYLSMTDHAFTPLVVLISPSVWNSMDAEDQAVIKTAAGNAMARNREEVENGLSTGLDELRAQGVTVVEDVDKASFRAKLDGLYDQFAGQFGEDRLNEIEQTK
ncbi:DctP family TRAP transporter solute-binding subunit [Martelella mediterranea]|uniref:Tripartite ATP-independent transporter DctP family solute receptor n=1 Tax=Martelella mediterranea TaxID=293089 RepID=A0A4R3ND53_9HYPH|nr:DctP family TRAP transporter solute-binding subunit [Martelella mediterranea]TCT28203.1 tripartite ATP-independent transporter DctP family solute receptor [Martelella mediterranea]